MAQANAFNAALIRVGFNTDTAQAIIDEGFDTLEVLSEIKEENVDQMIKNVRETRRTQGAQVQGNVTFPFFGHTPIQGNALLGSRDAPYWSGFKSWTIRRCLGYHRCPPIFIGLNAYLSNRR
jgi:hypothetical protein